MDAQAQDTLPGSLRGSGCTAVAPGWRAARAHTFRSRPNSTAPLSILTRT